MPEPIMVDFVDFDPFPWSKVLVCAFHHPLIRGVRMVALTGCGAGGALAGGYLYLSYWRNRVDTQWHPDFSTCDDLLLVQAGALRSHGWQEVGTAEIDMESALRLDGSSWIRGVFMAAADEFAAALGGTPV